MIKEHYSQLIKQEAKRLGFDYCGIAKATRLDDDAIKLERWLKNAFHGEMNYMANHFDKRVDPRLLVEDAKSVVTLLMNYNASEVLNTSAIKIASYAYGEDYHQVIRNKLHALRSFLQDQIGDVSGRGFVDSAPVLERSWAVRSGLGWVGKNGNLITKKAGSFYFIATLIIDLDCEYDTPYQEDYCGTCTRCLDACPTDAILPDKTINGSQCISYYTIELKEALIETDKTWDDWIFGCDICQDVCPWNRFAKANDEPAFKPLDGLLNKTADDWEKMTEADFEIFFNNSPIKRSGLKGIKRNLNHILKKKSF